MLLFSISGVMLITTSTGTSLTTFSTAAISCTIIFSTFDSSITSSGGAISFSGSECFSSPETSACKGSSTTGSRTSGSDCGGGGGRSGTDIKGERGNSITGCVCGGGASTTGCGGGGGACNFRSPFLCFSSSGFETTTDEPILSFGFATTLTGSAGVILP